MQLITFTKRHDTNRNLRKEFVLVPLGRTFIMLCKTMSSRWVHVRTVLVVAVASLNACGIRWPAFGLCISEFVYTGQNRRADIEISKVLTLPYTQIKLHAID